LNAERRLCEPRKCLNMDGDVDFTNAASGMIGAVKLCSSVASFCRFKIKSPGLIRSEGRFPQEPMRKRVSVSHALSKIQKGEFDLV